MAFDYNAMQNMATNLLTEFGNSFVLKKPTGKPVYDAETKKNIQQYSYYNGVCVMKTYTAEMIGNLENIINAGDVSFVCTLKDISVIPTEGKDQVVFGGYTYNVLHVATSNPNGNKIIVHTLHCRRAV